MNTHRVVAAIVFLLSTIVGLQPAAWGDADEASIVQGNNAFALDVYAQVAGQDGNLFFSPYSMSSALAMTFTGARNQTATQMAGAMHFSIGRRRLGAAFAAMSDDLDNSAQQNGKTVYQLSIANALWGQTGLQYNPDFLQMLESYYGAHLKETDFIGATDQATDDINAWVAKRTKDKIHDLFAPGSLSPNTRLVLVNAIYFKGSWQSQFEAAETHDQLFHLDATNTATVSMMRQVEDLAYFENDHVQVAEFPYIGNRLSMVILLPAPVDGLPALEADLPAVAGVLDQLSDRPVRAHIPKFQITAQLQLTGILKALGMKDAFTRQADFSGITTDQPLKVNTVVHKALIDVDEVGTEAAAATGVGMGITLAVSPPPPPVEFRANHPFILLIRDRTTGVILFMGRLTNPNS